MSDPHAKMIEAAFREIWPGLSGAVLDHRYRLSATCRALAAAFRAWEPTREMISEALIHHSVDKCIKAAAEITAAELDGQSEE